VGSTPPAQEPDLFPDAAAGLPGGFAFRLEFIGPGEEADLLAWLGTLPFREAKFQQYTARRRTVSYGSSYDYGAQALQPAPPVPDALFPLRTKIARWAEIPDDRLGHVLINEYQAGTPLGWHRDRPEFGIVAGVSLGGPARMRLRPYPPKPREKSLALELPPRSAYLMTGDARWKWQHSIPPTPGLRYSITFRTVVP
jgi:alkylated DNA repair dioxygenase AlkB